MTTNGHVRHLVIGAGFAGLGAAIKLDEDGETDFLVIEKGHDVGGTWRDNTYPGAACDVPSQLYSFSFAPNPDWSSSFSPQPEIHAYLRKVAARSGVLDRFRFGTTVEHAAWDEEQQHWRVRALRRRRGHRHHADLRRRRALRAAAARHRRHRRLPGRDLPLGPLEPRRRPARQAGGRHRHRRLVDPDRARGGEGGRAPRRLPAHRAVRHPAQRPPLHAPREAGLPPPPAGAAGLPDRDLLGPRGCWSPASRSTRSSPPRPSGWRWPTSGKGISDPALREAVTPDFEIGCKRILISNDYYPALDADHVDLVTDGIAKITGDAIVTADGTERPIDVLVVATGFFTTEQPIAEHIVGREGRTPRRGLARDRDGRLQGHHRARLPELLLDRRAEHGAGTLEHGLHDRVADRLHPRRRPHHGRRTRTPPSSRVATRRTPGTTTCSAG